MLVRSHELTEIFDGTYITIKDTTALQDYVDEGIDISTDIVSVVFTLNDGTTDYILDVTTNFSYLRDGNGFDITTTDLSYGATVFADGTYNAKIVLTENSTGADIEYTSETDEVFISSIKQTVITQTADADWKILYNSLYKDISSDILKRHLLISLNNSTDSGLIDNAESIRLALTKICS